MEHRLHATAAMAETFYHLFVNRRAYTLQSMRPHPDTGRHYYYRPKAREGEPPPALSPDTVRRHLAGELTIGIYAINPGTQRSKWVAIDPDGTDRARRGERHHEGHRQNERRPWRDHPRSARAIDQEGCGGSRMWRGALYRCRGVQRHLFSLSVLEVSGKPASVRRQFDGIAKGETAAEALEAAPFTIEHKDDGMMLIVKLSIPGLGRSQLALLSFAMEIGDAPLIFPLKWAEGEQEPLGGECENVGQTAAT